MRIRSIKPEFWRSKDIDSLSYPHRLLFIGIWSYVDDNGVGRDEIAAIIGDLFSGDMVRDPAGTVELVRKGLVQLDERHLIIRYSVGHHGYLKVVNWERHQKISHANAARYPEPDDALLESVADQQFPSSSGDTPETLLPGTGEQGNRGTEEQGKRATRISPDWAPSQALIDDIAAKAPSVDVPTEAEQFRDYYLAMSGQKGVTLDWNLKFRTWCRNQHKWNVERGWKPPNIDDGWMSVR